AAQVVQRADVGWIEFDGTLQLCRALVDIPTPGERQPKRAARGKVPGIARRGGLPVCDGFTASTEVVEQTCQQVVRLAVVLRYLHRLLQRREALQPRRETVDIARGCPCLAERGIGRLNIPGAPLAVGQRIVELARSTPRVSAVPLYQAQQ